MFNIFQKKVNVKKLRLFKNKIFSIELPPYWKCANDETWFEHEKDPTLEAVTFYNSKEGDGVIQIWTYTIESDGNPSKEFYIQYANTYLTAKMKTIKAPKGSKIKKTANGEYHYAKCNFTLKKHYWLLLTIAAKHKLAHISYNCKAGTKGLHKKDIDYMISSFRFEKV